MAKIDSRRIDRAKIVVLMIEAQLASENAARCYLEAYSNGREQGYSISAYPKRFSFSENRNSDSIVVYYGDSFEFSMQGNSPSDKVYRNSTYYFSSEQDAANFIVEKIING